MKFTVGQPVKAIFSGFKGGGVVKKITDGYIFVGDFKESSGSLTFDKDGFYPFVEEELTPIKTDYKIEDFL